MNLRDAILGKKRSDAGQSIGDMLKDNFVGVDDGFNSAGEVYKERAKGAAGNISAIAKQLWNEPGKTIGGAMGAVEGDLRNLMFEGGAMERPEDVLMYAAGAGLPMKAPAGALRSGAGRTSNYDTSGSDYFDAPNSNAGRSFDPALNTSYSGTKHTKPPSEFSSSGQELGTLNTTEIVAPEDLKGREMFFATGDRTASDRVIETIGNQLLQDPVPVYGGPRFMDSGRAWASQAAALKPKSNVFKNYQGDQEPLLSYLPMGERSGDFSKHQSEVYLSLMESTQQGNNPMPSSAVDGVDDFLRTDLKSGKDKILRSEIVASMPRFSTPEFSDWLRSLDGGDRAKILKSLDKGTAKKFGVPDVSEVRFATTEPELLTANTLDVGYRMATPQRAEMVPSDHPSYNSQLLAKEGTLGQSLGFTVPWTIGARDIARQKVNTPDGKAMPKDIKSFMGNPKLKQPIDQQWVDEVSKYGEILNRDGKGSAQRYSTGLLKDFLN